MRPPTLALALAGLALGGAAPTTAWGFAAAAPRPGGGGGPLRVLSAHAAGPPSASFSAAAAALCGSRGITCDTVGPPGVDQFNAVAAGEYDGVLAEVCVWEFYFFLEGGPCLSIRP
jgi:hypothetical protein